MRYPGVASPAFSYESSSIPVSSGKINPPADPASPPNPVTDATAVFGNMSDTVVNKFADQAWCAAPATPSSTTAVQGPTLVTKKIGSTQQAKMNIPVLRARVTLHPRPLR